jgi:hypothetical protein
MIFLLVLNLSLSVVSVLYIYPIEDESIESYESGGNTIETKVSTDEVEARSIVSSLFAVDIIGTLVASFIVGTIWSVLTKQTSIAGYAYGAFLGLFWVTTAQTFQVLWKIIPSGVQGTAGSFVVITIFGVLIFFIFTAGFIQMVTGGWKTYE